MSADPAARRRYRRYRVYCPVEFDVDVAGERKFVSANTNSLGEGGLGVISNVGVPDGAVVLAKIELDEANRLRAWARCVYTRALGSQRYESGFEFVWLSGRDRDVLLDRLARE